MLCKQDKRSNIPAKILKIFLITQNDGDLKNMFCSNFHFKLKRNIDDESDEEIDDIDDFFYSPYKKRKLNEEEDTASTRVAVTANITSVIS